MNLSRIMNNVVSFLDKTNGRTPMHELSAGEQASRIEFFERAARRVAKAGISARVTAKSTEQLEADLLTLGGDRFDSVVEVAIELARREYAWECGEASRDMAGDFDTVEM